MTSVEIVVAGSLGDLVESMFPELIAERQQSTRIVVAEQMAAAEAMACLGRAGIEIERVVELPEHPPHSHAATATGGDREHR
ncbi:MAG: hypothetical protein MUD05_09430 [Candidatus Nanopelagicales bacterium]|nr:hypothetical protein [Candidatus Nanopelagicales bacterium]